MAKRSIQGYVELASGLGELTRSRAKEAAQELLTLTGADATSKKVAQQASQLADELLTAAETNRRHLLSLIRREVESAMSRLDVSRLLGEVQNLGATVAALAGQVDELARAASGRGSPVSPPSRSDAVPSPVPVVSDTSAAAGPVAGATTTRPPRKSAPSTSTRKKATATKTTKSTATRTTAKQAPAKKTTATKAPANKAPAQKAAAKKAAAQKAAAKKAAAKKASGSGRSTGSGPTRTSTSSGSSSAATKAPARTASSPSSAAPSGGASGDGSASGASGTTTSGSPATGAGGS